MSAHSDVHVAKTRQRSKGYKWVNQASQDGDAHAVSRAMPTLPVLVSADSSPHERRN
jgi:hypothetical protein